MKQVGIFSATVIAALAVGCASSQKNTTSAGPSIEAKQMAVEQEASYVTEFAFKKGSSTLSEAAKADLRRVIAEAKQDGSSIREMKIITWGDSEYPSSNTKKLSKAEVDLVNKRNRAISDFVKSVAGGVDVDTHSMAERPGALKELFNTSDAQIKKSLETAGIPTTDTAVKVPSKASKSIVMVIRR